MTSWVLLETVKFSTELEELSVKERKLVEAKLREVQTSIESDIKSQLAKLYRETVVKEVTYDGKTYKTHRMRVGNIRLFFIILPQSTQVIFYELKRRKHAYD